MAAMCASTSQMTLSRKVAVRSTAFTGAPVLAARPQSRSSRSSQAVVASASRKEAIAAGVVVGVGAAMANPLVAQAGVTPTLKNLVSSVVAGGVVLAVIAGAITAIANFDPVRR